MTLFKNIEEGLDVTAKFERAGFTILGITDNYQDTTLKDLGPAKGRKVLAWLKETLKEYRDYCDYMESL